MLLAVDAGATKTEAVVYNGEVLGVGVSGPGNYHGVGPGAALENAASAISEAFSMADCDWSDIDDAFYGFAGVDSSTASRRKVEEIVTEIHGHGRLRLYNDGIAAFHLATLGKRGVVVAAGTGSVVHARDGERHVRVGGWGSSIGDEGSAYYIGRKGLQKATQSFDGRERETSLIVAFERALGGHFTEAISRFQEEPSVNMMAGLAPLVTEEAEKGDKIAMEICTEAGLNLAEGVQAARKQLGLSSNYIIGAVGGVFRAGKTITGPFFETLSDSGGAFAPVYFGYHVVIGSVMMYRGERGEEVSEGIATGLVSQLEAELKRLGEEEKRKFLFLK